MADGHANHGSACTRDNSRNLPVSLSNLIASDSESATRGSIIETEHEETVKSLNELIRDLATTSSEAVIQKMAKDGVNMLNNLRDNMLAYCVAKWPECPKEKLCRRITRTGGKTAAMKLASDIIVLAKYGSRGELTDDLVELFQKQSQRGAGNVLSSLSASLCESSQATAERLTLTTNIQAMLEEMDLKLCEAKENYQQSLADMSTEIVHLKQRLLEKESNIAALQSEVASIKSRYKTDYQILRTNYEDCKLEVGLLRENQMKLEQKYANSKKDGDRRRTRSSKNQERTKESDDNRRPSAPSVNNGSDRTIANTNDTHLAVDAPEQSNLICDSDSEGKENGKAMTDHQPLLNDTENTFKSSAATAQNQEEMKTNDNQGIVREEIEFESDFIGVERKYTKRIYLGGVKQGVDVEKIDKYITDRGVNPSVIRLLASKRIGTVAVKINVPAKDFEALLKKDFWPANIYVRPWLSVNKWSEKQKLRQDNK